MKQNMIKFIENAAQKAVSEKLGKELAGQKYDPKLVANTVASLLSRRGWGGSYNTTYEGDRDLNTILGYKATAEITQEMILDRYTRGDITFAIISAPVDDTWKNPPTVCELDGGTDSKFCKDWNQVVRKAKVWKRLRQLDTTSSLGRFAVLLLGIKDLDPEDSSKFNSLENKVNISSIRPGVDNLLYLQVYGESAITQIELDKDETSPNYMLPEYYHISAAVTQVISTTSVVSVSAKQMKVHHSRIIHVAENALDNDIVGFSRLLTVWNRLDDLEKIVGGAAESIWRMVREKMITLLKDGYNFDSTDDQDTMYSAIDSMAHEITNAIVLRGVDKFQIEKGQPVDPKGIFEVLISLISASVRIPQRILLGSERGNLASSQDEGNWAGSITARQNSFAEPVILRPFIDRLIEFKIISPPKNKDKEYNIGTLDSRTGIYYWPPIYETNDSEEATIANTRANAMKLASEVQAAGFPLSENEVRNFGGLMPIDGGDEYGRGNMAGDMGDGEVSMPLSDPNMTSLNGIQLKSVMEILFKIRTKELSQAAAAELITTVGIPLAKAQSMVRKAAGDTTDLLDAIDDVALPAEGEGLVAEGENK